MRDLDKRPTEGPAAEAGADGKAAGADGGPAGPQPPEPPKKKKAEKEPFYSVRRGAEELVRHMGYVNRETNIAMRRDDETGKWRAYDMNDGKALNGGKPLNSAVGTDAYAEAAALRDRKLKALGGPDTKARRAYEMESAAFAAKVAAAELMEREMAEAAREFSESPGSPARETGPSGTDAEKDGKAAGTEPGAAAPPPETPRGPFMPPKSLWPGEGASVHPNANAAHTGCCIVDERRTVRKECGGLLLNGRGDIAVKQGILPVYLPTGKFVGVDVGLAPDAPGYPAAALKAAEKKVDALAAKRGAEALSKGISVFTEKARHYAEKIEPLENEADALLDRHAGLAAELNGLEKERRMLGGPGRAWVNYIPVSERGPDSDSRIQDNTDKQDGVAMSIAACQSELRALDMKIAKARDEMGRVFSGPGIASEKAGEKAAEKPVGSAPEKGAAQNANAPPENSPAPPNRPGNGGQDRPPEQGSGAPDFFYEMKSRANPETKKKEHYLAGERMPGKFTKDGRFFVTTTTLDRNGKPLGKDKGTGEDRKDVLVFDVKTGIAFHREKLENGNVKEVLAAAAAKQNWRRGAASDKGAPLHKETDARREKEFSSLLKKIGVERAADGKLRAAGPAAVPETGKRRGGETAA